MYKKRNVVERSFTMFKQWRALATRYDTFTLTYRGVVLRAITIRLTPVRRHDLAPVSNQMKKKAGFNLICN